MTDELAKAVPKVMIEIAAQGLPHNMLLEVKVAQALFHALNEALESLNPPVADLSIVDPPDGSEPDKMDTI